MSAVVIDTEQLKCRAANFSLGNFGKSGNGTWEEHHMGRRWTSVLNNAYVCTLQTGKYLDIFRLEPEDLRRGRISGGYNAIEST